MNDCMQNPVSKIPTLKKECKEISENIVEDIIYRSSDLVYDDIFVVPEATVKEVFTRKSSWNFSFNVAWSRHSIERLNGGLFGLIMEEYYDEKCEDSVKETFLNLVRNIEVRINKNSDMRKKVSSASLKSLNKTYGGNFYNLSNLGEIGIIFRHIDHTGMRYPVIKSKIDVRRKEKNVK
jgi:hypothetical protein